MGFFTPEGAPPEIVPNVGFTNINALSPSQVAASLQSAQGSSFKVNVDFTNISTVSMPASLIGMTYHDLSGAQYTKQFSPISPAPKLKQFPPSDQLKAALDPYFDVLKQYPTNVGTVFLVDEPYLNGISKSELERAGAVARQELDARGLQSVKLGVIFAGGMFDSDFAKQMDGESGEYAQKWDSWYQRGEAVINGQAIDSQIDPATFQQWVKSFSTKRLTTYDLAGNMYTGGGIPQGFDVVGFDFYLGTILLDQTYEHSLSWFAANVPGSGCSQFAGQTMTQIRSKLSFFNDGPQLVGQQYQDSDRILLDAIFQCRMRATAALLEKDVAGRNVDLLMISGSNSNDVLEYDTTGNPKQNQPPQLIESRVRDEVWRAENFYSTQEFRAGLAFFTYDDEYDASINESIGGAKSMPTVMSSIYQFAKTGAISPR
ncbi:hypothetical protein C7S13_3109 [Burkholderia cepacia]|nr:hypothetical protein [Burkholderia cepacia]